MFVDTNFKTHLPVPNTIDVTLSKSRSINTWNVEHETWNDAKILWPFVIVKLFMVVNQTFLDSIDQ